MTIRPATADDLPSIRTRAEALDELHRTHLPHIFRAPEDPASGMAHLGSLIENPDAALLIADRDGQVAGYVSAQIRQALEIPVFVPRTHTIIDSLVVDPSQRRTGVGHALMAALEKWAHERGADGIQLQVYEFNSDAQMFYRAQGYAEISRTFAKRRPAT